MFTLIDRSDISLAAVLNTKSASFDINHNGTITDQIIEDDYEVTSTGKHLFLTIVSDISFKA